MRNYVYCENTHWTLDRCLRSNKYSFCTLKLITFIQCNSVKNSNRLRSLKINVYFLSCAGCDNGALASMYRADSVVPAGGSFNLTCEFICLKPHHVAQLWRMTEHGVGIFIHFILLIKKNVFNVYNVFHHDIKLNVHWNCQILQVELLTMLTAFLICCLVLNTLYIKSCYNAM